MELRLSREDIIEIYQKNKKFLDFLEGSIDLDVNWMNSHALILNLKTKKLSIIETSLRLSRFEFVVILYSDFIFSQPSVDQFTHLDSCLVNLQIRRHLSQESLDLILK